MARRWVLLVIDDATAQAAVEPIVSELGFHVTTAPDAAQGVVQAKDLKPVLVISNKPAPEGGYAGRPFLLLNPTIEPEPLRAKIALMTAETAPEPAAAPATPAEPAAPPQRWLVAASNDPATPPIVEMALLGLDLETAFVAEAAETTAKVQSLNPELFLCDLDLPGLTDGVAVLQALRRNPATSAIPLLLIGVQQPGEVLAKILAADATMRFHKKPLDAEKLRGLIVSLLAGEPAPAPEPVAAENAPAAVTSRGAALVLDTDPAARAVVESVLKEIGLAASPGDLATALAAASDLKPLLIVSDLAAPGAVDLLTAVRMDPLLREVPFLFIADMTAQQAMGLISWDDPTLGFVKKPLDPAKVKSLAAELTGWTG